MFFWHGFHGFCGFGFLVAGEEMPDDPFLFHPFFYLS